MLYVMNENNTLDVFYGGNDTDKKQTTIYFQNGKKPMQKNKLFRSNGLSIQDLIEILSQRIQLEKFDDYNDAETCAKVEDLIEKASDKINSISKPNDNIFVSPTNDGSWAITSFAQN